MNPVSRQRSSIVDVAVRITLAMMPFVLAGSAWLIEKSFAHEARLDSFEATRNVLVDQVFGDIGEIKGMMREHDERLRRIENLLSALAQKLGVEGK